MRNVLYAIGIGALNLIAGVSVVAPAVFAQETTQETPADGLNQIKLTEAQVKGFIAAQPDVADVLPKLQKSGDGPDAALEAELDGMARKHGFASFSEFDDVAANISIVMAGLDVETGEFTEPVEAFKKELADVEADTSIPEADKKQLIEELTEAVNTAPMLKYHENVDLVKAHREELVKALE
jgi:hypothetical protein